MVADTITLMEGSASGIPTSGTYIITNGTLIFPSGTSGLIVERDSQLIFDGPNSVLLIATGIDSFKGISF